MKTPTRSRNTGNTVMSRIIPGTLNLRLLHFHSLSEAEQAQALHRMGYSDHEIAVRTGLHVQFVRRVLEDKHA
jgi:hypothetical protein